MLEKFFQLSDHKTTIRTEVLAGITTFMTMAYILGVNPAVLSETGMDKGAIFTATAISSAFGTLVMALVARLPFAQAPGMGLNAFFAYTVVLTMGYSWQFALTAVFLEGIIFLLLTVFNIRELIVKAIPKNVSHSISVGIGLFIAFIGFKNAGIVVDNPATLVSLGDMTNPSAILCLLGMLITGALLAFKVRGALLVGILATTIIGIPLGLTLLPESGYISLPPSIEPIFFKFEFDKIFTIDMAIILFTFLFMDIFNTLGTLVGVASRANMMDKDGNILRAKEAMLSDAVATTAGAVLGTSTVTTYVESAAGVADGGRTGLTSLTVAGLFGVALFLAPVFLMIPAAALSPALIIVGLFMMTEIKELDLQDYTEAIPAFLTIILMPLTYSITDGMVFGMLSYVFLKLCTGQAKIISPTMYILTILFIAQLWGNAIMSWFR